MLKKNKETVTKTKKPFYKKWWFWVLAVVVIAAIGGQGADTEEVAEEPTPQVEQTAEETEEVESVVYVLDSNSEFRKVITLNPDTDMPVEKVLYKVPAGKYKATTDFEKVATLGVVKDELNQIEGDYPDEFNYVTEMFNITGKPEDFNEKLAKAEVVIEVGADESISVPNDNTIKLEEVK